MEKLLRGFPDTREIRDKTRFAQFTRLIIRAVAVAFGLLVAYLQIKDIRPDALLTASSADIIWRLALIFYYWAWVGGINFDINIQELAYVAFPGQGRWPFQLIRRLGRLCRDGGYTANILRKHRSLFSGLNRFSARRSRVVALYAPIFPKLD